MSINNINDKGQCFKTIAFATNKSILCDHLQSPGREACLMTIAKATKDIQVCYKLKTTLEQDACKYKVAKLKEEIKLCNEIKIDTIRTECKENFK
jgi:hypothetical protein